MHGSGWYFKRAGLTLIIPSQILTKTPTFTSASRATTAPTELFPATVVK